MHGKEKQLPGPKPEKSHRVWHWLRTLAAVLDDIRAVALAGFWVSENGLAAARAGKERGRRL